MPVIFRWNGYRFFFFSDEGDPLEPCHLHVSKGDEYAKIWIHPEVRVDEAYGMSSSQMNKLMTKIIENKDFIQEKWNERFGL